ncbi:hypothetical protein DPMN_141988 [Dreissena polymorpha]|uniref:Uncharacterized protein n=1 Tax=Dreissena polymorpha TaxID=45954 RepID=A0A9D4GGE2_DREPO|nr:hypothetical protein DPMN_141988 [Dreissena polymorpha]
MRSESFNWEEGLKGGEECGGWPSRYGTVLSDDHVRREEGRNSELHAVQNGIWECCCWDKQLKSPPNIVTNPFLLRTLYTIQPLRSDASMDRNKFVNAGMKRLVLQGERTFTVPLSDLVSRAPKVKHVPFIVKKICRVRFPRRRQSGRVW